MAYLIHPLPQIELFVKEEYLHDHKSNHKLLTPGIWNTVKSVPGKALYFETFLPEYGALYDKLPISAFYWKQEASSDYSLDELQMWNCFDYNIAVLKKPFLTHCSVRIKDSWVQGYYMFTIDSCHGDRSFVDSNFSEHDPEHKSFNIIKLNNGQFAAQPNNRILWFDKSQTPKTLKNPTFKVCTQNYSVENEYNLSFGHTDEWQYKELDQ